MKRIFFIVLTVEVLIKGEVLGTRCGRTRSSQVRPIPIQESLVCHRYYEAPLATITTSNYHNPIRDEKRCFFRIKAPPGRRIKVTFNQFNLPRDDTTGTCLSYIEVTNVFRRRHKDIKPAPQLCGSSLPPAIHSIGNILQVKFFSQGLAAGQGFSLTYSTEEKGICGGNLLLPSGSISTPMFTRMRDSYVDCKWSVFGDRLDNITVVFKLHVLDVPGLRAKYCSQGGMYVKPGRGSGSKFYREFEIYCGNYTSPVIFTSPFPSTNILLSGFLDKPFRGIHGTYYVNTMDVCAADDRKVLLSIQSNPNNLSFKNLPLVPFTALITKYSDQYCGGIINAPSDVNITSPGYPNGYPPNTDCHWIIQADYGELITLTTVDLHLENDCEGDYVSISSAYDFHMLGKFCGDHRPYPVTSRHHVLSVKFHSDESGTAPGFWMTTSKIQKGCGGLISMINGNISSPNYPDHYGNNEECIWIIEYSPGNIVKLEFMDHFDIEMSTVCDKDFLLIEDYDDNNESWVFKERKCGLTIPEPIVSKGRKIKITFHSNPQITGDGFFIQYSLGCGGNFTKSRGQIFSPFYPYIYKNINCTYTIGKAGQYIEIQFDDYLSSHFDQKDPNEEMS